MRSASTSQLTRTIDLDHDQLLVVQDRPGTRVDVYFGGLWLTEERRSQDRFVTASAPACIESSGRAIAQAIGRTRARIVEPARELSARGWRQMLRVPMRLLSPGWASGCGVGNCAAMTRISAPGK